MHSTCVCPHRADTACFTGNPQPNNPPNHQGAGRTVGNQLLRVGTKPSTGLEHSGQCINSLATLSIARQAKSKVRHFGNTSQCPGAAQRPQGWLKQSQCIQGVGRSGAVNFSPPNTSSCINKWLVSRLLINSTDCTPVRGRAADRSLIIKTNAWGGGGGASKLHPAPKHSCINNLLAPRFALSWWHQFHSGCAWVHRVLPGVWMRTLTLHAEPVEPGASIRPWAAHDAVGPHCCQHARGGRET